MNDWIIPIIPSLISVGGAAVSVLFSRRAAAQEQLRAADQIATWFREPLLNAISNPDTRIYNIIELDFIRRFRRNGAERAEREYVVLHTLRVFAQYSCRAEILRRDSQFIDPRDDQRTAEVVHGIQAVRDRFTDSRTISERCFRLVRGEPRALGEVMLVAVPDPPPGAPRWQCMGYTPFVRALETPELDRWFGSLRAGHDAQLRRIQRRLIDLIDIIDPRAGPAPIDLRKLVDLPNPAGSTA